MSNYKNAIPFIITLIIGFFSGGFVAYLGHIFSERRDRRKEFNKAAIEFRSAFRKQIKALRHYEGDTAWNVVRPEIIMQQEIAMEKFRFFLPIKTRFHFDMAWQSYSKYDPYQNHDEKESGYIVGTWDIQAEKKLILCKINTLLSFAEHK